MLATSFDSDTIIVRNNNSLWAGAPLSLNQAEQASIKVFEDAVDMIPETLQLSFTSISAVRRQLRRIIHGPCGQHGMTTYVSIFGVLQETIDQLVDPLRNRIALHVWWEGNCTAAIIKLMPGDEHEIAIAHLANFLIYKILALPGHNNWSYTDTGSTRFIVEGRRSKEGDRGLRCSTRGS